jgi:hypothetical protein
MTPPTLALVAPDATPDDATPVAPVAPDAKAAPDTAPEADADALSPEALLRALASENSANPFATGKRPAAIRVAGTALAGALDKVRAAREHMSQCERDAATAAERALGVLTGSGS